MDMTSVSSKQNHSSTSPSAEQLPLAQSCNYNARTPSLALRHKWKDIVTTHTCSPPQIEEYSYHSHLLSTTNRRIQLPQSLALGHKWKDIATTHSLPQVEGYSNHTYLLTATSGRI